MIISEAHISQIEAMHAIRMSVRENVLNNPLLVTEEDYKRFLTTEGKGWVAHTGERLAGFAIIDLGRNNVWALFVHPDFESKGIGRKLQDSMLRWFFSFKDLLWLTTAKGTRAEKFYRKSGWKETGLTPDGEVRFEMRLADWEILNGNQQP